MIRKILKTTDPILRQPVEDVVDFDFDFQKLVDDMVETMRKNNGVGLAAPQIGELKNVFVCEFAGHDQEEDELTFPLTVICNPKIVKFSKEQKKMVEGCLSFPGIELVIKRPENLIIKGKDRYGKDIEIEANKLYARAIQHEFDHLNSTLLIDRMEEIGVIFIGTGSLGAKTLELLINEPQYKIISVVTGEQKEIVSRNKKESRNSILEIARKNKLPILITKNIKDQRAVEKIAKMKADVGIMADFGQIIPKEVISATKHGIINIHPSLLPKYRGPSPITAPIINGDKITGVSLILTSEKMDAGDIIAQAKVKLSGSETSSILKEYLGELGATLLFNSLPYYLAGDLKPRPQNENEATYTNIVKTEDGYVDPNTSGVEIERKVRAFDSWPKVYTIVKNKRVQILATHFSQDGALVIDRVKPEGKKEMSYEDFKNGYRSELTFS